jgi:23S rRNA (uracil1939-C5)-methyltransferase
MAPGGEAIGRHEGMVVFVAGGLPGEMVDVELSERRRTFARGRVVRILEAAPERVAPPCPLVGRCGGCTWQHVAYDAQVRFKTEIVREQLARIGKLPGVEVRPCVPSPQAYAYRSRARLARTLEGCWGFRSASSHEVVPIAHCPVLTAELNAELATLAPHGPVHGPAGSTRAEREINLRADGSIITVGETAYRVGPESFSQANLPVAAQLVEAVLAALRLGGHERVLDLYCGVGLFTVPIARRARHVLGVEVDSHAVADALHNLAPHSAGTVLQAPVAQALHQPVVAEEPWDAVVLDPPRAGAGPEVTAGLLALGPPRLVYVSCDPATLARDLRALTDGGYRVAYVQPFDMFPQTHHVEAIAVLDTFLEARSFQEG